LPSEGEGFWAGFGNYSTKFVNCNNPYHGVIWQFMPGSGTYESNTRLPVPRVGDMYELSDGPTTAIGAAIPHAAWPPIPGNKYLVRWNGTNWIRLA
jgi:hypothetical protein